MLKKSRSISQESAISKESGYSSGSRRTLPPQDDPVLTNVIRTSVAHSRASSLHNLPIIAEEASLETVNPFSWWLKKLHRRKEKHKVVQPRQERWKLDEFENDPPSPTSSRLFPPSKLKHRKSQSWTSGSTAFLMNTRSAFASMSILTDKRSTYEMSSVHIPRSRRSDRNSMSLDTDADAVRERAVKRRQTIDEIVRTEREYILALKALTELYGSVRAYAAQPLRSDMDNMQLILFKLTDLHHDLGQALQNVPSPNGVFAEPKEGVEIAAIFAKYLNRFFLYEEYGSKYEEMLYSVGQASQNIPEWENYQRGFEMLSNSVMPFEKENRGCKKSLTFGDLHIKPVQRICKYPLFFAELCRYTPVIDGPDEHLELEKVLYRLRDTVMEINQATVDCRARERMQQSWKLQDMLIFPDPLMAPHIFRSLGHPTLCGALYVAYQSSKGIVGEYMLCILFKSYLIIANPTKEGGLRKYNLVACIALANIKIHSTDTEFGLQCLNTPCAWKLLFEVDAAMYELIVVASSIDECRTWMDTICENAKQSTFEHDQFSIVDFNTQPIGEIMGKPGSLLRSLAFQDAKAAKRPLIIRNTMSEYSANVSLTMKERLTNIILAPRRGEKSRIEEDIEKAGFKEFSKDVGVQRSRTLRSSASTLLRKLSRPNRQHIEQVI